MGRFRPLPNEHYYHDGNIYRVISVSRGTDEVLLVNVSNDSTWTVRYTVFKHAYKRVWKMGAAAKLLNRSTRSMYRYEEKGQIEKAKRFTDLRGLEVRYYLKEDLIDARDMIASIHAGKPNKDKRVVNNAIPSKAELLDTLRKRFGE